MKARKRQRISLSAIRDVSADIVSEWRSGPYGGRVRIGEACHRTSSRAIINVHLSCYITNWEFSSASNTASRSIMITSRESLATLQARARELMPLLAEDAKRISVIHEMELVCAGAMVHALPF